MSKKLHYITVATRPHEILNRLRAKCESQGESIIVLGEQENRPIGWNSAGNFGVKLKEVRDFLARDDISDDDIVLFTDAYDVIYFGERDEIVRRYLKFSKPIVFGCETTCNPIPAYEKYYTHKSCEFPFLNSGLFIGRAHALRQCVRDYNYNDKDDDQAFWTVQFLETNKDLIELDYNNELFLNTYGVDLSLINTVNGLCEYKGSAPLFVHVNGPDKSDLRHF
jgi:hypothetical protein